MFQVLEDLKVRGSHIKRDERSRAVARDCLHPPEPVAEDVTAQVGSPYFMGAGGVSDFLRHSFGPVGDIPQLAMSVRLPLSGKPSCA